MLIFISPFILFMSMFVIQEEPKTFVVNDSGKIEKIAQLLQDSAQYSVLKFTTNVDQATQIHCLIYIPEDYEQNGSAHYPLLTFLHGGNETGNDLNKVKRHGPFKLIDEGKEFPFIVVAPQIPTKFKSKWQPGLVDEVIELVKANFRVDTERLYLTGVSLGGAGVWGYALEYPEKIAAIAPICGWGIPPQACKMKHVPTWAFHGAKDKVVTPAATTNMINALKNCGADPKFTLYPNAGHDSWTRTYNSPALYDWFLEQSLSNRKIEKTPSKNDQFQNNEGRSAKPDSTSTITPEVLGQLPISIKESSGLWVETNNSFWTHNDSGGSPVLYNIDSTGKILQIKRIANATNFDWEDLTSDEKGNFYIGDFGNNKQNRKSLQIYKIPHPGTVEDERIPASVIEFSLPDQNSFPPNAAAKNFDIEAMISFKDHLYLFSKNNTNPYTGYCKMYKLPNEPGQYEAELIDSVYLGGSYFESSVTGAALSKDFKHLVLLSYSKLTIFSCFQEADFFSGISTTHQLSNISQKEAISFLDNRYIYITDEVFHNYGGYLYRIDTKSLLPECTAVK